MTNVNPNSERAYSNSDRLDNKLTEAQLHTLMETLQMFLPTLGGNKFWQNYGSFLDHVNTVRLEQRHTVAGHLGGDQNNWFFSQNENWNTVMQYFQNVRENIMGKPELVDQLFTLAQVDDEMGAIAWILICRCLSARPSTERQFVFDKIRQFFADIVNQSTAASFEFQTHLYLSRAKCLTTCSANFGAEAFVAALGDWRGEPGTEHYQAWTYFLSKYVHPQIYSPAQFLRAAVEVFDKWLDDEQKIRVRQLFGSSINQPSMTPDPGDIYAHADLPYLADRGEAELPTDLEMVKVTLGHLQSRLEGNKARILDLAAGTGRHIKAIEQNLSDLVSQVVGMDMTTKYLAKIKQQAEIDRAKPQLVTGQWFNLPFVSYLPDGAKGFDLALLIGRDLPHLANAYERRKFLLQVKRVLQPQGIILIDTPDTDQGEYWEQVDKSREVFCKWLPNEDLDDVVTDTLDQTLFTLRVFTTFEQLVRDAKAVGFKVIFSEPKLIPQSTAWNLYVALTPTSYKTTGVRID